MALTDKLVAIGDAIRGVTGGTGKMSLDEMAASIGEMGSVKYEIGTYTPAEDVRVEDTVISHSAGFVPEIVIMTLMSGASLAHTYVGGFFVKANVLGEDSVAVLYVTGNTAGTSMGHLITHSTLKASGTFDKWTENGFALYTNMAAEKYYRAGQEYKYILIGGIAGE